VTFAFKTRSRVVERWRKRALRSDPRTIAVCLSVLACVSMLTSGCRDIKPARPTPGGSAAVLPIPESNISASIVLDLSKSFAEINKAVPSDFNDNWPNGWTEDPSNDRIKYRYHAWRDPLGLRFEQGRLKIAANGHYEACGGYDPPIAPIIVGCCGNDPPGDGPRALTASITVGGALTPDWRISPTSQVGNVTATNPCKFTFLDINVNSKIEGAVRGALDRNLSKVNHAISSVDVKTPATSLWEKLQQPILLEDNVWLLVRPEGVSVGPLGGDGNHAVVTLGLKARPQIFYGSKPAPTADPLPELNVHGGDNGFFVGVEGLLSLAEASRLLRDSLVGRRIIRLGKYIEITDVHVYGSGGPMAVLEIEFSGDVDGRIFYTGAPVYNPANGELSIPELDFDIDTKNALAKSADWLLHDEVREFFRTAAKWNMAEKLEAGRQKLDAALKTSPSPGLTLAGEAKLLQGSSVHVTSENVVARVIAQGTLKVNAAP
jgi:hypothetical protein